MTLSDVVPDRDLLLGTVLNQSPNQASWVHGAHHWKCVATIGHHLLTSSEMGDPVVLFLFALFHDSMRLNDWEDSDHGKRGGAFARSLNGTLFTITYSQLALLSNACELHANGNTSLDPTISLCWDADRLNLWRLRRKPSPRYLSTDIARQKTTITWASTIHKQTHRWEAIFLMFDHLIERRTREDKEYELSNSTRTSA